MWFDFFKIVKCLERFFKITDLPLIAQTDVKLLDSKAGATSQKNMVFFSVYLKSKNVSFLLFHFAIYC